MIPNLQQYSLFNSNGFNLFEIVKIMAENKESSTSLIKIIPPFTKTHSYSPSENVAIEIFDKIKLISDKLKKNKFFLYDCDLEKLKFHKLNLDEESKSYLTIYEANCQYLKGLDEESITTLKGLINSSKIRKIKILAMRYLGKILKFENQYSRALNIYKKLLNNGYFKTKFFFDFDFLLKKTSENNLTDVKIIYKNLLVFVKKWDCHPILHAWYAKKLAEFDQITSSDMYFKKAVEHNNYFWQMETALFIKNKKKIISLLELHVNPAEKVLFLKKFIRYFLNESEENAFSIEEILSIVQDQLKYLEKHASEYVKRQLWFIYRHLFRILQSCGRSEEGLNFLKQGLSCWPENAQLILEYTRILIEQGTIKNPIEKIQHNICKYPQAGDFHLELAKHFFEKQMIEEGFKELQLAIELTPQLGESFLLYIHFMEKYKETHPRPNEEIIQIRIKLLSGDKLGIEWEKNPDEYFSIVNKKLKNAIFRSL